MSKETKAVAVFAGAVVGAFAVTYLVCRSRKGWYLEPGQPVECIPPAIRSAVKAGIFNALKVPLPVQFGIEALENQANRPCASQT